MKLFIVLIAVLALYQRVEAQNATSKATDADSSASDKKEKVTEEKTKETTNPDARGKRNLELGNHGYNYYQTVPFRADRRISNAYQDSRPPYYHPNNYVHHPQSLVGPPPSHQYHGKPPPYAVQMEPLLKHSEHDPLYPSHVHPTGFESDISNSVHNYQPSGPHHHQPVYLEAPEPIIEIIIKESNESAPYEPQPVYPSQKKKKEEVQVFYVKYHKDDKHGIVLDSPVPALKPLPDESEEEGDASSLHDQPIIVTPSPPLKTTTLRAIINPDSEKYHSNSGIRISFGIEDKHQAGHQISETESESVAQPVVALPQGHALPQPQALTQSQHQAVHQQAHLQQAPQPYHQHLSSQHKADQFYQQHQQFVQQRSFPTAAPFSGQSQYHQQSSQLHQNFVQSFGPSSPAPQFRPQPQYQFQQFPPQSHRFQSFDQGRNYVQHQPQPQFRGSISQPQQYVQPPRQQVHFSAPVVPQPQQQPQPQPQPQHQPQPQPQPQPHFFPQPQQLRHPQPQDFQQQPVQPKPIPIPLHNINNQPPLRHQYTQAPQQNQFNQPFNNFHKHQQTLQPPKPPHHNLPPPPAPQSPPQPPQQTRFQESNRPAYRGNFVENPRPVQGGLVQQAAPNLGPTRTPDYQASSSDHQNNLRNILPAGGELVQSVPKYESHITEHIKPDGRKQSFLSTDTYNIQPSQELISHSVAPQLENTLPKNYAQSSSAPPLPTPQQYISKPLPTPQIIPNSEPINQSLRVANQVTQLINVSPRSNFQSQQSQPQPQPQPQRHQPAQQTNFVWNGGPTFSSSPKPQQQYQPQSQPTFGTRSSATYSKTTPLLPTTTTTQRPTTTTPASAVSSEKKQKAILDLPDEVPDDIRQHLLSSGILDNADISVLDYDKLGETALENLPPEHLANFFSSGGASQLAGSSNVVSVVKPNGEKVAEKFISKNYDTKDKRSKSNYEEQLSATMPEKQNVDLKVVRFDSSSQKNVTDRYIKQDSTILPSVDITAGAANPEQNEQAYNRYLPLKINGAQFPIPDAVELRGRRISSVVVLAPVDNIMPNRNFVINAEAEQSSSFASNEEETEQSRYERDTLLDSQKIKFIAGEALKQLIKKPSTENFKRWLEREGKTDVDLQSVVLLVTRNENDVQEIFMYDIATKGVTHLNGELSQAFVKVAEENAQTQNLEELPVVDSGIVEQMEASEKDLRGGEESSYEDQDVDQEAESDEQADASEHKPIYVYPINSKHRRIQINSGYSSIKN